MLAPLLAPPETRAAELFGLLNELAGKYDPAVQANDIALARLRADGQQLLRTDPVHGAILLGCIAVLKKDEPGMRQWFARAAQQAAGDELVPYNHAIALADLGFFTEAFGEAQIAVQRSQSLMVLDNLITVCSLTGRQRQAAGLLERRSVFPGAAPHQIESGVRDIAKFMEELGILDDEVARQQKLTSDVMHGDGLYSSDLRYLVQEDEESAWLSGWWYIDEPVNRVVDLDWKLAERFVKESRLDSSKVNFMFVVGTTRGTNPR